MGTVSAILGFKGTKSTVPLKGGFGVPEEFGIINKEYVQCYLKLMN
ncbi:hypothetical protein [Clostridium taeniosporum]|nr:hypothetical protein [Clostridium taeniosporum]